MRGIAVVGFVGLVGCGGGAAGGSKAPEGGEPQTFEAQVALGQTLYGEHCAGCHGAAGEGGKAPKVVGIDQGALPLDPPAGAEVRKNQFKTAADVAGFVVKTMPANAPGSLKESEYWAILAFDLHANGVDLPQKIDASNASGVVIHK